MQFGCLQVIVYSPDASDQGGLQAALGPTSGSHLVGMCPFRRMVAQTAFA